MRWWSYRRQRLGRAETDPERALSAVVGVYSSHPSGPLSLLARVKDLPPETLQREERDRRFLRLPAMRGSIYLLPHASAHLPFAATPVSLRDYLAILNSHGVDEANYRRLKETVLEHAGQPRTVRAIRTATGEMDAPLPDVVKAMCREGVLLRVSPGSLRSNTLHYVSTEAWLGRPLTKADPESALSWLAGAYLRAFGPARPADFAWSAGIPLGRAGSALAAHDTVDVGEGYLLPAEDGDAFHATGPVEGALDLLPKWDCYTMGYPADGRERFVAAEHHDRIYDRVGNGLGAVLADGLAIGAWSLRFLRQRMQVTLDLFEPPASRLQRAITADFEMMATYLSVDDVEIQPGRISNIT